MGKLQILAILAFSAAMTGCSGTNDKSGNDGSTDSSTGQPGRCEEQCSSAADCGALAYECAENNRCECINDDLCFAEWNDFDTEGCETNEDCDPVGPRVNHRCVKWASTTFCASVSESPYEICQHFKITLELAESEDSVWKCHGRSPRCGPETKECESFCTSDGHCTFSAYAGLSVCDVESGRCVCSNEEGNDTCGPPDDTGYQCKADGTCGCATDARCEYSHEGPICDLATGECGCESDDDCTGKPLGEHCVNGKCGCADPAECHFGQLRFEGTTFACVPE
jgi:hypothetical protein